MDVLNLLTNEIKDKHWNKKEKARYLYLRCCELFSYDSKYPFIFSFNEQEEIKERTIDLRNIEDNRIVCTSFTKEILAVIYEEILGLPSITRGVGHSSLIFQIGKRMVEADATITSDLARVKMNLTTHGYHSLQGNYEYQQQLKEIDQEIGYITKEYWNEVVEKAKLEFQDETPTIEKLYKIKELLESLPSFNEYSDAEFAHSYLHHKLLKMEEKVKMRCESRILDEQNGNYKYISLCFYDTEEGSFYFTLTREEDRYSYYEIPETTYKNYKKDYKCTL